MVEKSVLAYYEQWVKLQMGLDVKIAPIDEQNTHTQKLCFTFDEYPTASIYFYSDGNAIDSEITKFLKDFQGSHPDLRAAQALKSGIQGFLLK